MFHTTPKHTSCFRQHQEHTSCFIQHQKHTSCLRQHLFTILYVNDFPEYVVNAVDMYADGSTLQGHAKDINTVENKVTEIVQSKVDVEKQ